MPSRQRPQALLAVTVSVGGGCLRGTGFPVRALLHIAVGSCPSAAARHLAPRQFGSSPGCCRIVREVSERSRSPSAVSGRPLPLLNQRHGVPCLARCISPPAAILSRRGTWVAGFRDRAGFPRQTLDYASAPGFPDCRVSPVNGRSATVDAELLRRAQDALDFRVAPARPSKDGYKAGRILPASSAGHQLNFQAAPAASGSATPLAPRHYRNSAPPAYAANPASGLRETIGSDGAFKLAVLNFPKK